MSKSSNQTNSYYSQDVKDIFAEYDINKSLDDIKYSKTIEEMILNNLFIEKYLDEYVSIDFIENEVFLEDVNLFLELGYNAEEINSILILSSLNQEKLKNIDYTNLKDFVEFTNFNVSNIDRYNEFYDNTKYDWDEVITYVNINLDLDFYEITEVSLDPSNINVLVNKYNALPSDYVPSGMTSLSKHSSYKMVKEAAKAADSLLAAALKDGFEFIPFSTYRSYTYQETLFNNYSARDGLEAALTYSAKPGHSEHQTGLAIDIYNPDHFYYTNERMGDEDYAWVLKNAHKYGYIVRYPADSEDITGYIEEPWHLRYLGVELATSVIESGLTYDEYYDLYLTEY